MTEVSAAELRASLCRKGPRPLVQSWDLVLLLRLTDGQLLDLHQRLTAAHQRGENLATVEPPPEVARYQAGLLARFIVEPPRKDRRRQVARDPGPLGAEQKLGAMVEAAKQASDAAERWLKDRLPQKLHRSRQVVAEQS